MYLVRHGETEGSAGHVYSGRAEVPLTAKGREQAREVGALLSGAGVGAVWSSPLRRAADTAEAIGEATGAPVRIDERLIEIDYGELEGLNSDGGRERFGHAFEEWRSDPFNRPLPGMEPFGAALDRARSATGEALELSGCPVIVGHQGILRLVLMALGELEPKAFFSVRLAEAEPLMIAEPALAPG